VVPSGDSPEAASGAKLQRAALRSVWPAPGDRHGPLVPMLIGLTLVTGMVDATSYLRLGHVFVANMTGNVVFLGFALAGAHGLSASSSLIALGSFLLGAWVGGRFGAVHHEHRGHLLRLASLTQAALLALALVIALTVTRPLRTPESYGLLIPMSAAMGIQNAAAQLLAVPELTTTVLTRTLTGIATELGVLGHPRAIGSTFARRLVAVAAMLLGALAGGLLALHVSAAAALAPAIALVLAVGLTAHLRSRSSAPWAAP
jgi:uncharacterized membrane protein YoaK (UPF0700 family)